MCPRSHTYNQPFTRPTTQHKHTVKCNVLYCTVLLLHALVVRFHLSFVIHAIFIQREKNARETKKKIKKVFRTTITKKKFFEIKDRPLVREFSRAIVLSRHKAACTYVCSIGVYLLILRARYSTPIQPNGGHGFFNITWRQAINISIGMAITVS